jgi:hypothetical protein
MLNIFFHVEIYRLMSRRTITSEATTNGAAPGPGKKVNLNNTKSVPEKQQTGCCS